MRRKILLVEPNYKNKFPPIALMKLSTYHKKRGDDVFFYKGDIKKFIIERITEQCIEKLQNTEPTYNWRSKYNEIFGFIKTRKKQFYEALHLESFDTFIILTNWLQYYKDFYWKKIYLQHPEWDRICVTTLFTFYFDITVKTINELKPLLKPKGEMLIGGVLATLQPEDIERATGIKPHRGLLIKPGELDEGDEQIIDTLPLDYTILDEIDYHYEMSNAYYGYLTRGCIRKCSFCAVSTLEPAYIDYIPLKERIEEVDKLFGPQKDLLLMDNNILASKSFDKIIDEIKACGFEAGAVFEDPDYLELAIKHLKAGINDRAFTRKTYKLLIELLNSVTKSGDKELSFKVYTILSSHHVLHFETSTKQELVNAYKEIKPIRESIKTITHHKQRIVDFNQGVDARLFTPHIAKRLSEIAISPLRIAFDNLGVEKDYLAAIHMCVDNKLKNFSNYLLYNFTDKPVDLFLRMKVNVELCEELGVNIYSFPMKFHPLYGEHSHDRNYIGEHWNKKYIRAIQAVLNSTKGMIGRGTTYFYKAFGHNEQEYLSLLEMPDTFIIYRFFFEWLEEKKHPLSMSNWAQTLNNLNRDEQLIFYAIIHDNEFTQPKDLNSYSKRIQDALRFYINYRDEITEKKGSLFNLKKEFDNIPKENISHIKDKHIPIINKLVDI